MEFPSWHVSEELQTGTFTAWFFVSRRDWETDSPAQRIVGGYDIDDLIYRALREENAIVYEVNHNFDVVQILHDPRY